MNKITILIEALQLLRKDTTDEDKLSEIDNYLELYNNIIYSNKKINLLETLIYHKYGISADKLKSKTRKREIVQVRQIAMVSGLAMGFTTTVMGGRYEKDHCTTLHAKKAITDALLFNFEFREIIKDLVNDIGIMDKFLSFLKIPDITAYEKGIKKRPVT